MSIKECAEHLNANAVTSVGIFQYTVKCFFSHYILVSTNPVGKVKIYAIKYSISELWVSRACISSCSLSLVGRWCTTYWCWQWWKCLLFYRYICFWDNSMWFWWYKAYIKDSKAVSNTFTLKLLYTESFLSIWVSQSAIFNYSNM